MYIRVLGSAAGGGFPQWNCNCANCDGLRKGTINAQARTQSSIAVSGDGERWVLFNTSPDILTQLARFPQIQPARSIRDTGIEAIVLMDSQIDHSTGLLMLREGCPLPVYCTDCVFEDLSTGFPVFEMLKSWNGGNHRHSLPIDGESFTIKGIDHLRFSTIAVDGKAPPYSPHRHNPHPGDNVGMMIEDSRTGKRLFYAPGLAEISASVAAAFTQADCLMIDGTFWRGDEMSYMGVGTKHALDMGHLPQSGNGGMIEVLRDYKQARKILIHINNTNPILLEDSPERMLLAEEEIEVSFDGMMIEL
ncbi:pyrroloquinoline quinone biosynthesis protein B [Sinobacterium caligoides]|uniref:Coenzyme PQQ synthesis protein B n=1 Tax=Sinobacterium caligoides TaxID=933926 RepID=A0A3N2DYY1_9GAMM|nr:pyrroloquinoline quinone biosynthesis protein PqqB [Sinobacterium caligoides]ROS05038.1 pyrroloquinoline quinone biosynthesis protein B [Sinobacterium caligoides]